MYDKYVATKREMGCALPLPSRGPWAGRLGGTPSEIPRPGRPRSTRCPARSRPGNAGLLNFPRHGRGVELTLPLMSYRDRVGGNQGPGGSRPGETSAFCTNSSLVAHSAILVLLFLLFRLVNAPAVKGNVVVLPADRVVRLAFGYERFYAEPMVRKVTRHTGKCTLVGEMPPRSAVPSVWRWSCFGRVRRKPCIVASRMHRFACRCRCTRDLVTSPGQAGSQVEHFNGTLKCKA